MANYAINPTAEQALRSNQTIVPQRVIAALALLGGLLANCGRLGGLAFTRIVVGDRKQMLRYHKQWANRERSQSSVKRREFRCI